MNDSLFRCPDRNCHDTVNMNCVKIKEFCKWKDDMTDSEGTLAHIWNAINNKVSTGLMITAITLVLALVGTLFGLLYGSNDMIIKQFGAIQTDIAVIKNEINK